MIFPLKRGIANGDVIWINSLEDFKNCVTQYFGENKVDFYKKLGMKGHNGLDINCLIGEDIIAPHDGEVTEVSNDDKSGLGVVVWSPTLSLKTIYWHNKRNLVKVGDRVKEGDTIAHADNTGMSTATHLHWGLKLTNEHGTTKNWDNGYFGAINPLNYLLEDTHMKLIRKGEKVWDIRPRYIKQGSFYLGIMGGYSGRRPR